MLIMQVFGNSNSLPISLVISLSQTLKGLHWDKIPGDNDDEVAARGILYLLIFQQLQTKYLCRMELGAITFC